MIDFGLTARAMLPDTGHCILEGGEEGGDVLSKVRLIQVQVLEALNEEEVSPNVHTK